MILIKLVALHYLAIEATLKYASSRCEVQLARRIAVLLNEVDPEFLDQPADAIYRCLILSLPA